MTLSFNDNYDYYKKMLELQEKLRKSEEERIRLEERFKVLVQESRTRHDACINRLRLRYIEFLEEQRTRDEKCQKLLTALDKVDNNLASMTAKTDRLNVLRKLYEAYLRNIYTIPNSSLSIVNENNTPSQYDKYITKNVTENKSYTLSPRIDRSIFPSASKLSISNERTYYDKRDSLPSTISNWQISNDQNPFRSFSLTSQNNELIQQPQQNFQPKFDPLSALDIRQTSLFDKQSTPHFDLSKSFTIKPERTETASHFVIPKQTNSSMSQYKLDIPQNRFTPTTLQHQVHSSFRRESDRILSDNRQTNVNKILLNRQTNVDKISPVHRTIDRNMWDSPSYSLKQVPSSYSWKKFDYFKTKQKSMNNSQIRSTFTDIDNIINRHKRLISRIPNTRQIEEEGSPTNDLDRYIDKIRRLLNRQNSEEVNNRNIFSSFSDDLGISAKSQQKENIPAAVEKLLALADDLVSRTVDLNTTNATSIEDKTKPIESIESIENDIPISKENSVTFSDTCETKDKINKGLEDIETNLIQDNTLELLDPIVSLNEIKEEENLKNITSELREDNVNKIADSSVDQYEFDTCEEMEPWNLDLLAKGIKEVGMTGETEENEDDVLKDELESLEIVNKENFNEDNAKDSHSAKDELKENDVEVHKEENVRVVSEEETKEISEYEESNVNNENTIENVEAEESVDKQNEFNNEQINNAQSEINENNEEKMAQDNENYYENSDQAQNYEQNYETEYLNEKYNYDQNYDPNAIYDVNQEQNYDPNASYETDKNYDQSAYEQNEDDQNQEYVEESNQQYEEYTADQYNSENQYANDPNVEYQEDSKQEREYTYTDQQYDPNQYISNNDEQKEVEAASKQEVIEKKPDVEANKNEILSSENEAKKQKDIIKSLLDSDTDSTIERNVSNAESDFDFN